MRLRTLALASCVFAPLAWLACGAPHVEPVPGDDAGTQGSEDGGADAGAGTTLGADGGTLDELAFAVVGDTRPSLPNYTSGYPRDIIHAIFTRIASRPVDSPAFVVGTGDYQFSIPFGSTAEAQWDQFLGARSLFKGPWYPAMGNHECTGATNSNCGAGNSDGETNVYKSFMDRALKPLGKVLPYYALRVDAKDGTWTSKFVFVAPNAWDGIQEAWLNAAMAEPTTYTFVVRHEPWHADTAPGTKPSEAILNKFPFTLKLVGHTHTYLHDETHKELLVGNGGAPLSDNKRYGYALLKRRASDGAISVEMHDYETDAADTGFHFAVNADGSAAAP